MEFQLLHEVRGVLDVLERTTGDPGDLTSALQHIAQTAQSFFSADDCVIFAINPITNRFIASLTIAGDLPERDVPFEHPRPTGLAQEVLSRGVLLVEDLEVTPEYQSTFTRLEDIRSFAGLALHMKQRQKPLGVLYLNFRQPQHFSPNDHELFQLFAEQASYILHETWLLRRHQEVARIGQEINQELDTVDILFHKLQTHVAGILDTSFAFLLTIYQPQTSTLDFYMEEAGRSIILENEPLEGACQHVIETQHTLFIRHMSQEAEDLPFQRVKIKETGPVESLIFVPLVFRGVSLGVLSIQHPQPNAYNQEDLFILQLLANHIALALNNIRLYNNLNRLNETGQFLTQQLDSEQVLQSIADNIREATQADVVVLYPYEAPLRRFVLPPRVAGTLLDTGSLRSTYMRPTGIAALALHHAEPIFAKESDTIYTTLQRDIPIQQGNFQQREKIHSTAAVPLQIGEESVGVLFVNYRQPQRFDATQKLFIEGLTHYAAIAIKNAQAFGTLAQRRVRELEALQKIDRELSHALDLSSVLHTILKLAHERVPAEEASILLLNPRTRTLETASAIGHHAEASQKQILSLQETRGIACWVVVEKKPARVNNVRKDSPWRDLYLPVSAFTISELDVPLLDGDEVVGVLNFESTKEGTFQQEDQDFLLTLAGQAVLAIKNAQAYEREKRLAEEGRVLNQISKEITSQLDLNHVFDLILERALELTHSTRGNLMLYDQSLNDLWMAAERGVVEEKKGQRQGLDQGIVGRVAIHKQLLNVDLSQPPWNDVNLDFFPGTRSELAVPMLAGNKLLGVLNIESLSSNNFNESDERLVQGLADLAVVALQNAQAYEREKRLAEEGQVLNQISKEITSQLDLNHVFDLILEKALELTHSMTGGLLLYDSDQNDLWIAAEHGMAEDKNKRLGLDLGIAGYVARTKQLLNVDPSEPPWNDIYLDYIPGTRSELAVPMLAGNDLRGILDVESTSLNNFKESDERLITGLASLAVVALQNAQAYEREKRLVVEGQLLNEISKEITSQLDPAHVFDLILEKALELTHSTLGALLLYNSDLNDLTTVAARGMAEDKKSVRLSLQQGIVGYVARNKQLVNADLSQPAWEEIHVEFVPGMCSELAVPMLAGDDLLGVLYVESPNPNNFSERDQRLLQGLADLAAVALQNAQAYEREKRLAAEARVLNEISKEISSQLDPIQVFDFILEKALELTHSTLGSLHLYDPSRSDLWMVAERGVAEGKKGFRQKPGTGIVGYVAAQKQLRNVKDVSQPPWNDIYMEFFPGACSEMAAPMLEGNELRGVLNVESPNPNNFNESDERLLQGLADLAVVALQNTERYKQAETETQHFELLYQAGQELSKITDLDQLDQAYNVVVQIADNQSQSQAVIYRYDEANSELVLKCTSPYRNAPLFESIKLNEGLNGQVARERRTIVIDDANHLPLDVISIKQSDPGMYSFVVTHIMFKDQYYGNLGLRHEDVGHFRGTDIHFFEGLAQQLASTIHRLETVQARQEFEQRALAAEEMSLIGQSAFEITHRLGNDLGLVNLYISDIQSEMEKLGVTDGIVSRKLDNISQAVQNVLSFSGGLKQELANLGAKEEAAGEAILISSRSLLEEAQAALPLPSNISIRLEIDNDVAAARGIHSLVADILRNLVANAIQAMPKGGTITLRGHNAGRHVALEVRDTGIGIPPERLSKIYGLFFSTKGSSGFGLWSARRNALRNHGELKVESKVGQGTTFTLLLPRADLGTS